jgi:hypothetical protein
MLYFQTLGTQLLISPKLSSKSMIEFLSKFPWLQETMDDGGPRYHI